MASKRKEKEKAPQTSKAPTANSNALATQANIAKVYEMVTRLLLRITTPTPTSPPPLPMLNLNVSYLNFQRCHPSSFEEGLDPIIVKAWMRNIENIFRALQYPNKVKLDMVVLLL